MKRNIRANVNKRTMHEGTHNIRYKVTYTAKCKETDEIHAEGSLEFDALKLRFAMQQASRFVDQEMGRDYHMLSMWDSADPQHLSMTKYNERYWLHIELKPMG